MKGKIKNAFKHIQTIDIADGTVEFPCFADVEGQVSFQTFHIAAVTFHIGHGPNTGHHRTALKYHGSWLVYDDNKLPDHADHLTDEILRNMTMTWLVHDDLTAVRTMHDRPGSSVDALPSTTSGASMHQSMPPQPKTMATSSGGSITEGSATIMNMANSTLNEASAEDTPVTQDTKRARTGQSEPAETERSDEVLSCEVSPAEASASAMTH